MKNKFLKGACLFVAASMLPMTQVLAEASWGLSGWVNEGVQYYDDGGSSDIVQVTDNGTTLATRMTFAGSADLANTGMNAGFEIILEPLSGTTPLIFSNQAAGAFSDTTGHAIGVLGNSVNLGGAWGKVTVGLQSMPTDNIAVLADPSLTLWASISPVFRGNGFNIIGPGGAIVPGVANVVWGGFLNCLTAPGLQGAGGIGLDCNGIYRNGVRYDLPTFIDGLGIAVGYANDDIYDVAAKWNGQLGRLNAILHVGYAQNNGPRSSAAAPGTLFYDEASNLQIQAGLMDPVTGLFGSIAYQNEDADATAAATAAAAAAGGSVGDDTDAYWLKVGIKKAFTNVGDTSLAFQYGSYNDQYDSGAGVGSAAGIRGSEVERIGIEINQYFGSKLIIYGVWENLDLDVDGTAAAVASYAGAEDLDTFTLGFTYFY